MNLMNFGDGTFYTGETVSDVSDPASIAVGDFNHDGKMDIAVVSDDAGRANNLQIFLNTGGGMFTALPVESVPHSHIAAITALTQAGQTNLATVSQDQSMVTILVGGGSGVFTVGLDYAVGTAPVSIATEDYGSVLLRFRGGARGVILELASADLIRLLSPTAIAE